jgi:DNA-binding CsgD family transcriptional regulator
MPERAVVAPQGERTTRRSGETVTLGTKRLPRPSDELPGAVPGAETPSQTQGESVDCGLKTEDAHDCATLGPVRDAIAGAARQIARLREQTRSEDPALAFAKWRTLLDARWSLVDHFEHDGRHYLLAERGDANALPVALLTPRERQVVALAALGWANKVIAYELGIAVSTAGVLLGRAAHKLGARSRRELIAAFVASRTRNPED